MPKFNCIYCHIEFFSKHSVAKFCSREHANSFNKNFSKYKREEKYSDEFLLEYFKNLAIKLGRTPTKRELTIPSENTYRNRFGSLSEVSILVGLEPNLPMPEMYKKRISNNKFISLRLRYKIFQRDNYRCRYCGGTPEEGYQLHVDHIIPRSKGGKDIEENLITSCNLCNEGKSNL